jgi:dihydrofolate reductase
VASRGKPDLSWAGSTQLGPDLAGAVREIRDRHEHVKVVGSLNLAQTLLREKLFDRLDLWVHPIAVSTTEASRFDQMSKTSRVLEAVATTSPRASATTPSVNPTRDPDLTTVPVAVSSPLESRTALR